MELMKYSITLLLISQQSTEDSHHNKDVSGTDCKRVLAKPLSFYLEYLDRKFNIKGHDVGVTAKDSVNAKLLLVPRYTPKPQACRQLFLQNKSVEVYPFLAVQKVIAVLYVSSARSILLAKRSPGEILSYNIDSHKKVLWKAKVSTYQMVVDNERKLVFMVFHPGLARAKTNGKEFRKVALSLTVCCLATDTYSRTVYVLTMRCIVSLTYDGQILRRSAVTSLVPVLDYTFAQVYSRRKVLYYIDYNGVYEFLLRSNKHNEIKYLSSRVTSAVFYKDNIYLTARGKPGSIFTMNLLNKTTYRIFKNHYPRRNGMRFLLCLIE